MSFTDAYSDYNQIPVYDLDIEKMTLKIEWVNYQYNVMHFGVKNAEVTYYRKMKKTSTNK